MDKQIRISDAEWKIMQIVWEHPHLSGSEIYEILKPKKEWNYRTVKTLISRLVAKGALEYKTKKNIYYYYEGLSKKDGILLESRSFLKKVFDGATTPMLAYMVKNLDLSAKDITELKKILNEREKAKK